MSDSKAAAASARSAAEHALTELTSMLRQMTLDEDWRFAGRAPTNLDQEWLGAEWPAPSAIWHSSVPGELRDVLRALRHLIQADKVASREERLRLRRISLRVAIRSLRRYVASLR